MFTSINNWKNKMKTEDQNDMKRKMKPSFKNLLIGLAVLLGPPALGSVYSEFIATPRAIKNYCELMGYIHPEGVRSILREDLNRDSILDYILYLKDGKIIQFVSDFRGYNQIRQTEGDLENIGKTTFKRDVGWGR